MLFLVMAQFDSAGEYMHNDVGMSHSTQEYNTLQSSQKDPLMSLS